MEAFGICTQAVNITVRSGIKRFHFRRLFHRLFDVRRILVNQIVQRNQYALLAVFQHVGLGEFIDVGGEQISIRIVAACQRDLPFFLGTV
ncbi:hypothetical protein D3C81_1540960 [compost metagenome]